MYPFRVVCNPLTVGAIVNGSLTFHIGRYIASFISVTQTCS